MSRVSVLTTTPENVLTDYGKAIELAGYRDVLSRTSHTIIKLNLSWTEFFPACSTPPWQLDGVLGTLRKAGYSRLTAVENQTVVTHPWKGAYYNRWLPVLKRHNVAYRPLTNEKWVSFRSKKGLEVMPDVFGDVLVPKFFKGSTMVHLPTMKTHGHTVTTGAMKDAFGGLIPKYRHHAHKRIHEVLVDLLQLQQELHRGLFAVMDGCVCGDGAGPRTMRPVEGNMILASSDQVAVDAVAARIMGFDPMKIGYIRLAHDKGLGMGDTEQIDIVGMSRSSFNRLNLGFVVRKSPIILWDQRIRKNTEKFPWLHNLLFRSPVFRTFIAASEVYHDRMWYPTVGKDRIRKFMKTGWGKKLRTYSLGKYPNYQEVKEWDSY
ncbi:DUF362 domain-containing protein [Candidatus Woesearchaeota archaeon]|nr:DUF362 domain-containing protein [Candidatus Woesearchaeota archaeon]